MKKSAGDRILMFLKMRGEATSQIIAADLGITKEGARKHLLNLASQNLIESSIRNEKVGRPTTYYSLTPHGTSQFPDTHADLTVQILQSVKNVLGENALNLLINDREQKVYQKYKQSVANSESIDDKLEILAKKRSEEGYMAEWKKDTDAYYFIENHCPICAAATECQGFCKSEINNFKQIIGSDYSIERIEYIITGGQRCTYRIIRNQ